MVDISDLFSSDSDSDEDEDVQLEASGGGQPQPLLVEVKKELMEEDCSVMEVPTTSTPGISWSFPILVQDEGLFKPDVVEIEKNLPNAKKREFCVKS
ncbi:unnamed protein product [Heligmosomoides polygyrus]|uniref:MATH domain-containing protein n=1 Tax=Heligmosomoides polygyrus TaxID=6339 RepID=A0A183GVZ2_HELPZ|nr:unnamed protein product [Heligmosomoides polygyrus]